MPNGPRLLIDNSCYHIIARGNQKQKVFLDSADYDKCLKLLHKYKRSCNFRIYAYCLMPNHIHLLGEPECRFELAKLMRSFLRAYTAYFNFKYNKVGHLWQGRFKSKVIVKDDYIVDSLHYIELNPVRASLARSAGDYQWSSHKERIGQNYSQTKMLDDLEL